MTLIVRTTRTLRVTEQKLTPEEVGQLAELAMDPRYESLLNVMERACISIDTAHLETPSGDPEAVMGGHCVSKAAWAFFLYVQKQVQNAYLTRTGEEEENRPAASLDDLLQGVT